jgi:hypothetical protein
MSYAVLMVHLDGTPNSGKRARLAVDLADRFQSGTAAATAACIGAKGRRAAGPTGRTRSNPAGTAGAAAPTRRPDSPVAAGRGPRSTTTATATAVKRVGLAIAAGSSREGGG